MISVAQWRRTGESVSVLDAEVFAVDTGTTGSGEQAPLVILHGFPGSSHDWADVIALLAPHRRVLTLDLPGYGLSGKPPGRDYSLFVQADVVQRLLADRAITRCVLIAHDMGDTVAAEFLSRHSSGALGFEVEQVILTNGSIFIDQAQLTRGQRLTLRLPARALPFGLPTVVLRRSLLESFTASSPPPPQALEVMIELIRHDRGDRLLPRLIRYIEERRVHQARWIAGLVDYDGPLSLLWGEQDPIAVVAMAHHLASLRPGTCVETFADLGHWPSIEAPERVADAVLALL